MRPGLIGMLSFFNQIRSLSVTNWARMSRDPEKSMELFTDFIFAKKTLNIGNKSFKKDMLLTLTRNQLNNLIQQMGFVLDNANQRQIGIDRAKLKGAFDKTTKDLDLTMAKRLAFQENKYPNQSYKKITNLIKKLPIL